MKFHVIKRSDGMFLGHEFEQGHRYSTMTVECDYLVPCWDTLAHLTYPSYNFTDKLTIFESKEAAEKFIDDYGLGNVTAVAISSLETEST